MSIATDYTTDTLTPTSGTLNISANATVTGNITSTVNVAAQNLNLTGSVNSATIRVTTYSSNSDYILSPSDSGASIYFNSNNPTYVNVGINLPVGFRAILTSINVGTVTIRGSSTSVSIHPRIGTQNQITGTYASASLVCYAANSFILDGSIQ